MAASPKDREWVQASRCAAAHPVEHPLMQSLQRWQQRVPEARRLTWRLCAPKGTDAALVRRTLLEGLSLSPLPDPLDWDACDVGFDVSATGSSPLFGEALARAAQLAGRPLVLCLPRAQLSSPEQDLQAPDAMARLAAALSPRWPGTVTLGTRWRRSPDDACWAVDHGLPVRLVPGTVADPRQPQLAPAAGLLATLRRLAGRVPHATLAWPDVSGLPEAVRVLRAAGTPCDIELAQGQPIEAQRQLARRLDVPVRIVCDSHWPARGPLATR